MKTETNPKEDCCCLKPAKEKKGYLAGLTYGIIPHLGCIAFVILSIIGATTATTFLKPLMIKSWFFYLLIAVSFSFATLSALIYLKKNHSLSWAGIRHKKKYLAVLYGTTLLINCLFFLVIFPYSANLIFQNNKISEAANFQELNLAVSIPCSGHASLIFGELKKVEGILDVKFQLPNIFKLKYELNKTNSDQILAQQIFQEFPAKIVS